MVLRRDGNSVNETSTLSQPCLYMGIRSGFAVSTNDCTQ